jgi:hypothetical protein
MVESAAKLAGALAATLAGAEAATEGLEAAPVADVPPPVVQAPMASAANITNVNLLRMSFSSWLAG